MGELLTVKEIAGALGVATYTVGDWIRKGQLRGVALSRRSGYRVRREDLAAFLASREGRTVREVEVARRAGTLTTPACPRCGDGGRIDVPSMTGAGWETAYCLCPAGATARTEDAAEAA